MPTQVVPAVATPANAADDPAPAQAISDATQPAKAAPAGSKPSQTAPPASAREAEQREAEQRPPATLTRLAADPGHAPELLALAAVQTIGPRAKEWAKRTREVYPKANDTALARLAADQFTRFGSPSSIVGAIAGSYAPATLIASTALNHARVILHVAAAYGIDPTDEARAADLLVLTRLHSSLDEAETAVAAVKPAAKAGRNAAKADAQGAEADKQSMREEETANAVQRLGRMVAINSVGWAAVRLVRRYFPGSGLVAAALVSRSSARTMAHRANTYYSQASHVLGRTV
jgi:hypothetical protein